MSSSLLFHLTTESQWLLAQNLAIYQPLSLEKEGFIHASTQDQVLWVANQFYRNQRNLVLLYLDPDRIKAEIKWEAPIHPQLPSEITPIPQTAFPHIYGALNLDAVIQVIPFHSNQFLVTNNNNYLKSLKSEIIES